MDETQYAGLGAVVILIVLVGSILIYISGCVLFQAKKKQSEIGIVIKFFSIKSEE